MSFAQAATGYCEVRELPTLNGIEIPSLFILNQGELAQMEFMKAAVLTAFGDAEKFEIQTVPTPTLKANQVLVRVCATSINPVDYQTRRGDYKELVQRFCCKKFKWLAKFCY